MCRRGPVREKCPRLLQAEPGALLTCLLGEACPASCPFLLTTAESITETQQCVLGLCVSWACVCPRVCLLWASTESLLCFPWGPRSAWEQCVARALVHQGRGRAGEAWEERLLAPLENGRFC